MAFDTTDSKSFGNIKNWVDSINQHAEKGVPKILVGNKIDLEDDREISKTQGEDYGEKFGLNYFETSAKANIGIKECMDDIFE